MKLSRLLCVLAISGSLALASCASEENKTTPTEDVQKLEGISIKAADNATKVEVVGTLKLSVVAKPSNAIVDVLWTSVDSTVATVDDNGLVTGLKPGVTIIKATSKDDAGINASFNLTVEKAAMVVPTGITLKTSSLSQELEVGKALTIITTVLPAGASQGVSYKSSDDTIAAVSASGLVTGLKEGKATISVKSKANESVEAAIEITVIASSFNQDVDFESQAFSTHDEYMKAAKEARLKVHGVCTHLTRNDEKQTVSYYLQNGYEGFYVTYQDLAVGNVELGKSYEVGGLKQWKNGQNSITNPTYFKEAATALRADVKNVSNEKDLSYNAQKANMGSLVKLDGAIITDIPAELNAKKGYNIGLRTDSGARINLRISPSDLKEKFDEVNTFISKLSVNQILNIEGLMTSFGYGKPASQILILDSNKLAAKELTDADKVNLAASNLSLPRSITSDIATIDLKKTDPKFDGLAISYTSNSDAINTKTGVVNHQAKDTIAIITATVELNGITKSREFKINVMSLNDDYLTEVARLDFEDASLKQSYGCSETKSSYKDGDVNLGGHNWAMHNALIAGAEDDRRTGTYGARIQTSSSDNSIQLLDQLVFDTLEFNLANYGSNKLGAIVKISYAAFDGEFIELDDEFVVSSNSMQKIRVKLPVEKGSNARVKISVVEGTGQRINIDDIRLLLEK